MLLSRVRPTAADLQSAGAGASADLGNKFPKLQDFLDRRDFVGALSLLEFQRGIGALNSPTLIAYCAFHLGDYKKAVDEYQSALKSEGKAKAVNDPINYLNIACCYFSMGMYKEAQEVAEKGPEGDLKLRILFHLAEKLGDEENLIQLHRKLEDTLENQLSLASVHYLRGDFQSSIDIYKRILLDNRFSTYNSDSKEHKKIVPCHMNDMISNRCETQLPLVQKLLHNREFLALNVYVALCYHRLQYYDVSQEVLAVYLQSFADSAIALNLRSCNTFHLYTGTAAEKELKPLLNIMQQDEQTKHGSFSNAYDLIRHNLVVFRTGEGALQIFPKLIDVIPEARHNLIIYYLHQDDVTNAHALLKGLKPKTVSEYMLHAVVNVMLSQQSGNKEYLAVAQNCYSQIGSTDTENDTVFGRLCMASAHFLNANFDHCALYMNSVRTHYYNDDTFNFNYGQALGMQNQFDEAEKVFALIQSEKVKNDLTYIQWMTRCLIMNKKPIMAWEMYEKMETSPDSIGLLQLIANECYRMGQFYYAAKAFDALEKFDPSQENWEGKRGACVGVFQLIIAGHEPRESLHDIINFLRRSSKQNVEKILTIMRKWAKENRMNL